MEEADTGRITHCPSFETMPAHCCRARSAGRERQSNHCAASIPTWTPTHRAEAKIQAFHKVFYCMDSPFYSCQCVTCSCSYLRKNTDSTLPKMMWFQLRQSPQWSRCIQIPMVLQLSWTRYKLQSR